MTTSEVSRLGDSHRIVSSVPLPWCTSSGIELGSGVGLRGGIEGCEGRERGVKGLGVRERGEGQVSR